jgi:hypothetical protein
VNFSKKLIYSVFAAALFIAGCSQYERQYESPAADMSAMAEPASAARMRSAPSAGEAPANDAEFADAASAQKVRKLVKQANLRLRVPDLEEAEKPVQEALNKYKGYSAKTVIQENSRSYTLRIPAAYYDEFLSALGTVGKVLYRSETAEDVTLRYYDLEGRLQTKRDLLATFQSYLRKAKNIEEIMSVESRIAELQNDIDWLGTQLKGLADLTDYATVSLELYLPASASVSYEPTLFERIKDVFFSFGDFLSAALVVIVSVIVYGIPLLAFAACAYWLLLGKVGLLRYLWRIIAKKNH